MPFRQFLRDESFSDRVGYGVVGLERMTVSPLVWILTLLAIVGLLLFDYFFHVRSAHVPTLREAAVWSALYVGIALLFGFGTLVVRRRRDGLGVLRRVHHGESAVGRQPVRVPDHHDQLPGTPGEPAEGPAGRHRGLLIARAGFIFLGSALLNTFAWVFYLFGIALLMTAGNMLKPETEESHSAQNLVVRLSPPAVPDHGGLRRRPADHVADGHRMMTPMLLVMVAIGGTDLMFALDSIPAIFGLTQNVYVVFTATAFSLLGLRQLYFLLDGLLDRLIYLSFGLAAILAFIGAKLILHALHENNLPFVNGGDHVEVVEISTGLSLIVILVRAGDHDLRVPVQHPRPDPDRDGQRPPGCDGVPRSRSTPTTRPSGSACSSGCCGPATTSSRSARRPSSMCGTRRT